MPTRAEQNVMLDETVKRLIAEHNAFQARQGNVDSYHVSRGITGEPSERNRVYRASDDCWKRGLRTHTVGVAPGTIPTGTATVRVIHSDGHVSIESAHSFRKENVHKKQRVHAITIATERHRITAADLAPIVTHYD